MRLPTPNTTPTLAKKRIASLTIVLVVLLGLWYAFRPEKLFVNKRVNEAAPAAAAKLTPLFTGQFTGAAHQTSGRATIYQQPDGSRILALTNFSTSNGPAVHVILSDKNSLGTDKAIIPGDSTNRDPRITDLGELKGNQGDQNYPVPKDLDMKFDVDHTTTVGARGAMTKARQATVSGKPGLCG